MGLGVAGLQALATARRLGAMTEGYDVRPETKEQAESLGASFVDTGVDARGAGGYARELTQEEKDKVAAVVTKHIQHGRHRSSRPPRFPGRPSPKLISKAQVEGMKAGAVIVDLAAEGGGNCEYTQAGRDVQVGQVTIVAPLNVPSMLGEHASELYAKNQFNLIELFVKDRRCQARLERRNHRQDRAHPRRRDQERGREKSRRRLKSSRGNSRERAQRAQKGRNAFL